MIHIEFFRNVKDRNTHSVQPLDRLLTRATTSTILKAITSNYREWLKNYPTLTTKDISDRKSGIFNAVTFSGTFTGTGKAQDIKDMSGLIVLDIDHIENLPEVWQKLKTRYTHLMFISPSGDGIKLVLKHNLTDPLKWQYLYYELEAYYLEMFSIELDKSGKDINRMCFIPYIEHLYKNDDSTVWQYTGKYEKTVKAQSTPKTIQSQPQDTSDDLVKECYYISKYLYENKICMTQEYNDWIAYGYSLCELGEQGRNIFHNISMLSDKYDADALDNKYDYMLDHYDAERNSLDFYIDNGNCAIAQHIIKIKYGFNCQQ
jgi:VirE N-terminal domain/Primase C terminal 2 (PriCT-2)